MNISLITVGKIKEKYFQMAIEEYSKRLSAYCKLKVIEVKDEKTQEDINEKNKNLILQKEGQRISKHIKDNSYVIALDIKGKSLDSEELAGMMDELAIKGKSNISFVIGGSLGLCEEILKRSNYRISFSDMTFPHQLMRVILLEQIYRAYRINLNQPYHK